MKKFLLSLALLSIFLTAASQPPVTVRLTIINKSGYDLALWLNGTAIDPGENLYSLLSQGHWIEAPDKDAIFYYFTVKKGSRAAPTIQTFEIVRGQYTIQALHTKPWDPVYPNNPCIQHPAKQMLALRSLQLTFTPCFEFPPNPGEPSQMKFWQFRKQLLF